MLKEMIKNGKKTVGTHLNFNDIAVGRIAGLVGYDFVWIDMEHSYLSFENLLNLIIAVKAGGSSVLVRAPQDDLTATKKILEMGLDGIIFPMIRTKEEADRIIATTLYPPHGSRGFGPINAVDFGLKNAVEFALDNHKTMCRFIQIEHIDAVKNLDEIMKNEYIDGYIVGPFDLSASIGRLGDVFGNDETEIVREVVAKLKAAGKYVGVSTGDFSESTLKHWHDLGFDMISSGADYDFVREGMKKNLETLKKIHLDS